MKDAQEIISKTSKTTFRFLKTHSTSSPSYQHPYCCARLADRIHWFLYCIPRIFHPWTQKFSRYANTTIIEYVYLLQYFTMHLPGQRF